MFGNELVLFTEWENLNEKLVIKPWAKLCSINQIVLTKEELDELKDPVWLTQLDFKTNEIKGLIFKDILHKSTYE